MNVMQELLNSEQKMFQESLGLPDWKYVDLPKLTEDRFDELVSRIGEGNIRWITQASYETDEGTLRRGQMMISPEGREQLSRSLKDDPVK